MVENPFTDPDIKNATYPVAVLVRLFFLKYLRLYFYCFPPGSYKYDPDETLSEIVIKDSFKVDEETIMKRPAIVLNRGPILPAVYSFDSGMADYDVLTDTKKYLNVFTTELVFSCYATNLIESETIASYCLDMLLYFREDITLRGVLGISNYRLDPPEPEMIFGSESKIEAFKTITRAQIYMFDRRISRFKNREELEKFKEIVGTNAIEFNVPPETLGGFKIDII